MSAVEEDSVLDSDSDSDSDEREFKRTRLSNKADNSQTNDVSVKPSKDVGEGIRSDGNTSTGPTSSGTHLSPIDHVLEKTVN
jgi:hypothetical protein